MPTGKNTPFNITLIGLLLCMTLVADDTQGACIFSSFRNKLVCHFHHANLFHWFCNAMALWLMRPRPEQIAYAYPLAVMAMFFTMTPTVGFSAILYAYMGMNILRWNVSPEAWATFIAANLITLFIPGVAFGVHMAAFLMGMATYIVLNKLKLS